MQLHDILLLRTSAILPEAISAGGLTSPLIQACFSPPIEVGVISHLIYSDLIGSNQKNKRNFQLKEAKCEKKSISLLFLCHFLENQVGTLT